MWKCIILDSPLKITTKNHADFQTRKKRNINSSAFIYFPRFKPEFLIVHSPLQFCYNNDIVFFVNQSTFKDLFKSFSQLSVIVEYDNKGDISIQATSSLMALCVTHSAYCGSLLFFKYSSLCQYFCQYNLSRRLYIAN